MLKNLRRLLLNALLAEEGVDDLTFNSLNKLIQDSGNYGHVTDIYNSIHRDPTYGKRFLYEIRPDFEKLRLECAALNAECGWK